MAIALLAAGCGGFLGIEDVYEESDAAPDASAPKGTDGGVGDGGDRGDGGDGGDATVSPPDGGGEGAVGDGGMLDATTDLDGAADVSAVDGCPLRASDAGASPPVELPCYPSTQPAGKVCAFGEWHTGECTTTAECADAGKTGMICVANRCAPCSQDFQCSTEYPGMGFTCVDQTCAPHTCTDAGSSCGWGHVCCPSGGTGGALQCISGDCCAGGNGCVNHYVVASGCPLVTAEGCGPVDYYVNPSSGSDQGGTGAPSCPFQTITHALAYVAGHSLPGNPTRIHVVGAGSTAPETNPMAIPENVMVLGPDSGTPIPVRWATLPDGSVPPPSNIVLAYPASGLEYFSYEGVIAAVGAVDRSTVVSHVHGSTVSAVFAVAASNPNGGITIGPGFQGNSVSLETESGSVLVLTGPGDDQTSFDPGESLDPAIAVVALGSIDIEGDDAGIAVNGIFIHQGASLPPYPNTVRGVRCSYHGKPVSKPGIEITGGSSLTLRDTSLVGNQGPGLQVVAGDSLAPKADNFYTGAIDLGTSTSPGGNTFQNNLGADISFGFVPTTPLAAEGNTFGDGGSCSGPAPPALTAGVPVCDAGATSCAASYNIGLPPDAGPGEVVDVAHCTVK